MIMRVIGVYSFILILFMMYKTIKRAITEEDLEVRKHTLLGFLMLSPIPVFIIINLI